MGNFISNQRTETLPSIANKRYTEQGMIAYVDVEYMKGTDKILSETIRVLPTWVDRYNGSSDYRIIPLDGDLDSNETLLKSGHLSRSSIKSARPARRQKRQHMKQADSLITSENWTS